MYMPASMEMQVRNPPGYAILVGMITLPMEIFLDTANLDDIVTRVPHGIVGGVTTNPTLIAKEWVSHRQRILDIHAHVPAQLSVEVLADTYEEMVREGQDIASWTSGLLVKIPATEDGIRAIRTLAGQGIATNTTLVFQPLQALLAAQAGATWVSPFVGRLDDVGADGMELVADIMDIFRTRNLTTKVLVASVRSVEHVIAAAKLGAHGVTIPVQVYDQLLEHPLTRQGLERFRQDGKKILQ